MCPLVSTLNVLHAKLKYVFVVISCSTSNFRLAFIDQLGPAETP